MSAPTNVVQEFHEGRWRASCPLPFYLRFGRCRCECGERFRNEDRYRAHWRAEHAGGRVMGTTRRDDG